MKMAHGGVAGFGLPPRVPGDDRPVHPYFAGTPRHRATLSPLTFTPLISTQRTTEEAGPPRATGGGGTARLCTSPSYSP